MAAFLRARGIAGWKLHPRDVIGRPDIYFPAMRTAIFLDGCFWHACRKCFHMPAQNYPFWARKILANTRRDKQVNRSLKDKGIRVVRLWEHDLEKRTPRLASVLKMLLQRAGA